MTADINNAFDSLKLSSSFSAPLLATTPGGSIRFIDFPPEIRDNIYECIVGEPNPILSTCERGARTPRFYAASSRNRNVHDLNIFRASKQVFAEARRIFFSRNVFDINLIEENSGLRYNFVPTEWEYAIKALRHIKVSAYVARTTARRHGAAVKLREETKINYVKTYADGVDRYILERATDLRSLEVWITEVKSPKASSPNRDMTDPMFTALSVVRNLHRLKIVVQRSANSLKFIEIRNLHYATVVQRSAT